MKAATETTSQTSPQASPNDPRVERKKALELQLKQKQAALANMQERIFATQMEILEMQARKEGRVHNKDSQDRRVVGDLSLDDTGHGSEWTSDESLLEDNEFQLSC